MGTIDPRLEFGAGIARVGCSHIAKEIVATRADRFENALLAVAVVTAATDLIAVDGITLAFNQRVARRSR